MYNFVVALVVKIGMNKGVNWNRRPRPLKIIPDPILVNTNKDPIKFLSLQNIVLAPTMNQDGKPWRGAKEKSDIFFQILIEACSLLGSIVVDLTASTGALLKHVMPRVIILWDSKMTLTSIMHCSSIMRVSDRRRAW